MMKKQILSTVFSVLLSLILAITLLLGCMCVYARETICKPEKLTEIAILKGYTQELYDEIVYSWENYLAITGVSEPDTVMKVLTPERIQTDALSYIRDSYTGKAAIDTTDLQEQLNKSIREYVASTIGDEDLDATLEANINELVSACMQTYNQAITIPLLPKLLGAVGRIEFFLLPASLLAFGFSLVIMVFIFYLQKKRRCTLCYTAIATATNTLLFVGVPYLAERNSLIARLPFDESALRTFVTSYLQFLLNKLMTAGLVFLTATVVLALLYLLFAFMENRKTSNELL